MKIIETFENLPKLAKVLLLIFVGLICPIYRIVKYLETKNTNTLIAAILCFVPVVGTIIQAIDIITEVTDNKIKFFAE
jgi:type II secretory pathway component PulF